MGTRSVVGIVNSDDSVTASYVHWDGYIEGVGKKLLDYYNDSSLAARVARVGYASSLLETVELTRKHAVNEEEPMYFENFDKFDVLATNLPLYDYMYLWSRVDKHWIVKNTYPLATAQWSDLKSHFRSEERKINIYVEKESLLET